MSDSIDTISPYQHRVSSVRVSVRFSHRWNFHDRSSTPILLRSQEKRSTAGVVHVAEFSPPPSVDGNLSFSVHGWMVGQMLWPDLRGAVSAVAVARACLRSAVETSRSTTSYLLCDGFRAGVNLPFSSSGVLSHAISGLPWRRIVCHHRVTGDDFAFSFCEVMLKLLLASVSPCLYYKLRFFWRFGQLGKLEKRMTYFHHMFNQDPCMSSLYYILT